MKIYQIISRFSDRCQTNNRRWRQDIEDFTPQGLQKLGTGKLV